MCVEHGSTIEIWPIASSLAVAIVSCIIIFMFFPSRSNEKQQDQYDMGSGEMFDAIAPRYDVINKVMSLGMDMQWRGKMVAGLQLRPGDKVVDMATGTADVAIMISKEIVKLEAAKPAPSGSTPSTIVGIDPSAKMLEVGREKVEAAGLSSRVELQLGDAQDLSDIPDGSIDKVTMAFGIRNVPDRLKALKEIRRIIAAPQPRPVATPDDTGEHSTSDRQEEKGASGGGARAGSGEGSVVAILELQDPESGILSSMARMFIKLMPPLMGLVVGGKEAEYGHLKNSILNFPSVAEWTAMMDDAGLEVFSHETMASGTVHLYLARPKVEPASS